MDSSRPQEQKIIEELAGRYGVSSEAVTTLFHALVAGNGNMAQFSHPELGGLGQWSHGMTMIGDMFNSSLKAKVDGICSELANFLREAPSETGPGDSSGQAQNPGREGGHGEVSLRVPAASNTGGSWWGSDLGDVTATGAQNNIRYAYFGAARRLAVKIGDQLAIYDTGDHQITGISQRQSGDSSLTFVSQHGVVPVAELHVVSQEGGSSGSRV